MGADSRGVFGRAGVLGPGRGKPVADTELAILGRAPCSATDLGPNGAAAGSAWAKSQLRSRNRELQPRRCSGGRRTILGMHGSHRPLDGSSGRGSSTRNPKTATRITQPPTPNPRPSTLNPEPGTLNPEPAAGESGSKGQAEGLVPSVQGGWVWALAFKVEGFGAERQGSGFGG